MGQYYKTREFEIDNNILDYFYLNNLKNYDEIYIIKDSDYDQIFSDKKIVIFENKTGDYIVNDNKQVYLNLKILNNANIIYLKDKLELLDNDIIKSFIEGFRGIIICSDVLVYYLKDLGILSEEFKVQENTYLKIDKYGKAQVINI